MRVIARRAGASRVRVRRDLIDRKDRLPDRAIDGHARDREVEAPSRLTGLRDRARQEELIHQVRDVPAQAIRTAVAKYVTLVGDALAPRDQADRQSRRADSCRKA